MKKKFMNPLVDAGFKRIFGRKKYMIEFLNDLLVREHPITDITFLDKEMIPPTEKDHGVVYDLFCKTADGEQFIVEMQYKKHSNFKERTVYYMARNIVEQSQFSDDDSGKWDYALVPVYCVYLLNFHLNGKKLQRKIRKVMLVDVHTNEVFYDNMTMYFFELPSYSSRVCRKEDCKNNIDKWLYVLVNMNRFKTFPFKDDKPIFMQMEELADLATFNREEMWMYERSLDRYRTYHLALDYSHKEGIKKGEKRGRKEGRREGRKEGRKEGELEGKKSESIRIAKLLLADGMTAAKVAEITGLSLGEITKENASDN